MYIFVVTIPCGRHHDLADHYGISVSQRTTNRFLLSWTIPGPFFIHDLTPGATSGAGTAYPSGAHGFTPWFYCGFVLIDL